MDEGLLALISREAGLADKLESQGIYYPLPTIVFILFDINCFPFLIIASMNDQKGVADTLSQILSTYPDLKREAMNAAELIDPVQRRKLQEALAQLEKLLPAQKVASSLL